MLLRTLDERRHRYPSAAAERELIGGGGAMALPLMLGSEPLGAVGVTLAGSERFGSGNQRFHEAVTQQLAQALQRVALLEVDRASADRLQFLAEASEVLSESLVEEETLDKVAHLAVPRFADWATVGARRPGRQAPLGGRGPPGPRDGPLGPRPAGGEPAGHERPDRPAERGAQRAAGALRGHPGLPARPDRYGLRRPGPGPPAPAAVRDPRPAHQAGKGARRHHLRPIRERTPLRPDRPGGRRGPRPPRGDRPGKRAPVRGRASGPGAPGRRVPGQPDPGRVLRLSGDPRACGPARRPSPRRRGRRLRRPGRRRGVPGRSGRPP